MRTEDFIVSASCTECGWRGPRIHLRHPEILWRRHVAVRAAGATYWLHLLLGTRHTHWMWSR